ncbi:MAG: glycosyl hydrolase 108 family protein [Pseudomonadota bacterium]
MSPFVAIAGSVLPEILKIVLRKRHHGSVDAVSEAIDVAVKEATETSNPADATKVIDKDPKVAADLRIRLTEIAAKDDQAEREYQERKRETERKAEEEKREFQLRQIESSHSQAMEKLKSDLADAEAKRQQEFKEFQERLSDVRDARQGFEELAASGSKFAWAPPVISTIIVVGFFSILGILLLGRIPLMDTSNPPSPQAERLFQIVNIVIGALTAAFATVVSFWLGSSQGSKQKDINTMSVESRRAVASELREQRLMTQVASAPAIQVPVLPTQPLREVPKQRLANESNFSRCIQLIFEAEGDFVDHPEDPGGATNMGITFNTLKAWRHPEKVTVADVRNLAKEEAEQIYRANYWNALSCDDLPGGVDLVVFDFGVNAGTGRSAKTLQRLVGVKDDGVVGPITLAAVATVDAEHIVRRFGEMRLEFYEGLSTASTFGEGWKNRVRIIEAEALSLLDAS